MNRKQKIDAIYEKIARKDLSFGCKVLLWGNVKTLINYDGGVYPYSQYTLLGVDNLSILHEGHIDEIIGHPVMIGDVLDWIENNMNNGFKKCCECGSDMIYDETYYCSNEECENEREPEDLVFLNKWDLVIENIGRDSRFINNDIFLWKKLKAPIEDQSDECVDFVYDLIFKSKEYEKFTNNYNLKINTD